MYGPRKLAFLQVWPRCLVIILGLVEVLAVLVIFATEFGNVSANFWTTNVFAGGWCGFIMMLHCFSLFVAGCCAPGPSAALLTLVITIIAMIACAAMISFDAVFIALPSTCILTSSCASNAVSTTLFSYYLRQNFFTTFRQLAAFTNYTEAQAKFLFQLIQLCVGGVCLIFCIVYLIIFTISRSRARKVGPGVQQQQQRGYQAPQANYQQQRSGYNQQPRPPYTQQTGVQHSPQPSAPEAIPRQ